MWDYGTPLYDIMDGLNRVVKAGKVRYIGLSNCYAYRLAKRPGETSARLEQDSYAKLKYDRTVNAAIRQIKDRHYTQALEGYAGEILAVGINYDRDDADKRHSCAIERLEKR
jgi:aryl-alcohol dehydrogenase-like predicted oxidoreductase